MAAVGHSGAAGDAAGAASEVGIGGTTVRGNEVIESTSVEEG